MPTSLECRFGIVTLGLQPPPDIAALNGFVAGHFSGASQQDVQLACTGPQAVAGALPPGAAITALFLHRFLLGVTQNPLGQPTQRVAVLFASRYAASGLEGAFGVMFDRGFTTGDDPNGAPIFTARPREGCAVFLDTIRARRGADYGAEVKYTTVHELGHVFNLQHADGTPNFMRTSDPAAAFSQNHYRFTPPDQSRLATCSHNPAIMPGGSRFGSAFATNDPPAGRRRMLRALTLAISVPRTHVFRFEPTQLTITLALTPQIPDAPVTIPRVIDPSHAAFRLFIENDLGERRLYRPPLYVCGPSEPITVSRSTPFSRDLPIFGQSGGYTFDRAGRYRVWAEVDLPLGRVRSNVLTLDVASELGLSAEDRRLRRLLTAPAVGSLLFHRETSPGAADVARVSRYLARSPNAPSAGELNYTVARALLKGAAPGRGPSRPARAKAARFLEAALSDGEIGAHQRRQSEVQLTALAAG
jgi:hypothetical protein